MLTPAPRKRHRASVHQACTIAVRTMPKGRPSPRIGLFYHVRAQGVPLHVPQDGQKVVVFLNRERLEAALVQRAGSRRPMRRVPALRMRYREPTHELRQVAILTRPKHEMLMRRHNAPRQHAHRQPLLRLGDDLLEVPLLGKQTHLAHTTVQHVVRISPGGNSQASWHSLRLPSSTTAVKGKDSRRVQERTSAGWRGLETRVADFARTG